METPLLKNYSTYLRELYGETVYRVGVDGGFSCPNRGERSGEGCLYCDVWGSRSAMLGETTLMLEEQIRKSIGVIRKRYKANAFILYFQAYSSTWAPVDQLKKIYDRALGMADFKELIVSTRPDCLSDEVADLLSSYITPGRKVWVELGLQSSREESLVRIRRGHSVGEFDRAMERLGQRGIKRAAHLIFGLPGETEEDMMHSVDHLCTAGAEGIKFHNLHIPEGSPMFREYLLGELTFPSSRRHVQYLCNALERIPAEMVVMRLTTDSPRLRNKIPGNHWNKSRVYEEVRKELLRRGTCQGSACDLRSGTV